MDFAFAIRGKKRARLTRVPLGQADPTRLADDGRVFLSDHILLTIMLTAWSEISMKNFGLDPTESTHKTGWTAPGLAIARAIHVCITVYLIQTILLTHLKRIMIAAVVRCFEVPRNDPKIRRITFSS
jgi:hypothetical protein